MKSYIPESQLHSHACPAHPQPNPRKIRARIFQRAACSLFSLSLALASADALAARSNTVNLAITANATTYAILANPYSRGGNTVAEIFADSRLPNGSTVYKFAPSGAFVTSSFSGGWSDPSLTINAGEGFFFSFNSQAARVMGATLQLSFSGELAGASQLPPGGQYGLVGSPFDKSGLLVHDLGYPVHEGDSVYKFSVNGQGYVTDEFIDGQWDSGSEPRLGVAEGFFLLRRSAANLPAQWNGPSSPGQFVSAQKLGGTDNDAGQAVALDRAGNSFVGGSLSSRPFVAKYSSSNSLLWQLTFSGLGGGTVQAVAADGNGDVWVTGNFAGALNFGGGTLTSAGGYDIFVAKFSSSGTHLWSKRFGTANVVTIITESGFGIAVDANNAVAVTGIFDGAVDFGGGILNNTSGQDLFLVKFSANGSHLWSKRVGGASVTTGKSVAFDAQGNIVIAGIFSGGDLGEGPVTALGSPDLFLAKYTGSGAYLWSKHFGDRTPYPSSVSVASLALDGFGNVVVAGNFRGTMSFGGDLLTSAGQDDMFLAKYAADGTPQWSKRFGGPGFDAAAGVAVDGSGSITLAGRTGSTLDFGSGLPPVVSGTMNAFVANFGADGTARWAKYLGVGLGQVHAVAVDLAGHTFATGQFAYTADFGGGSITSAGKSWDIFLIELAP